MDRRCRCEMTVGKSFYFIVTNFSFVIISVLVFWSMTELKRQYLDVTIANPWVRLSSYTKDDVSRSMPVWSPNDFWQLPYLKYTNSIQTYICFWSYFISKWHSNVIREEHLQLKSLRNSAQSPSNHFSRQRIYFRRHTL